VAQFLVQTGFDDLHHHAQERPHDPAATQNQLFGDDLFVSVLDAPTSTNALLFQTRRSDTTIHAQASPGLVRGDSGRLDQRRPIR
jgi:hypothetical protein